MLEKTYTLELPDGVVAVVDRDWLYKLHEQLNEEFKVVQIPYPNPNTMLYRGSIPPFTCNEDVFQKDGLSNE